LSVLVSRQNRELACITISHAPRSSAERPCDVSDLRGLAAKGSGSADILKKMLIALSVDPQAPAKADPALMRDLQPLCIRSSHHGRRRDELARGTAAEHFREFCPNAYTLDALFKEKEQPYRH